MVPGRPAYHPEKETLNNSKNKRNRLAPHHFYHKSGEGPTKPQHFFKSAGQATLQTAPYLK